MKKSNIPMRRCIGCMESKPQKEMVRIALYEGVLTVDTEGKAKGRGIYLCRDRKCMETAKKRRAIIRGFKGAVTPAAADETMDVVISMMESDIID
ncbi:MAG: YlxR family protein [Eubacteriaceae bacterium]|nr:YlxR family protein [Eubacteriaceae bacterium]